MKKILSILACLMLCLSLFACNSAAPTDNATGAGTTGDAADETDLSAVQPITVKFAHGYAGTELAVEIVEEWMRLVTERTDGVVQWDYYPGGSLGSITELIEQTDLGAVDCTVTDTSQLENFVDEYAILFYPFLIQSYEHQQTILNDGDIMNYFNNLLGDDSGLHVLGYYVNGVRNIASKKLIKNLDDCKGVIMRTPEIQVYKDVATLLGMSPTTISYSEMYSALSTGICEAIECPNNSIYPGGYHKIAPYILKSGHMYSSCAVEINSDFWNGLPEEVRTVVKETFDSLTAVHAEKVVAADDDYYAKYVQDGATVSEWDDPQSVADVCVDYWETSAEKFGSEAVEVVRKIEALRQ
jgi:TRAP-type C4-dicarboxylate transport system substrate-binding protein